jgi:hypothetical protein
MLCLMGGGFSGNSWDFRGGRPGRRRGGVINDLGRLGSTSSNVNQGLLAAAGGFDPKLSFSLKEKMVKEGHGKKPAKNHP